MGVDYLISAFPSKWAAYHSLKQKQGIVKLFVSTIYKESLDFEDFVDGLIFYTILERICLERGFQRIKMKNRCHPCKMIKYARVIFWTLKDIQDC